MESLIRSPFLLQFQHVELLTQLLFWFQFQQVESIMQPLPQSDRKKNILIIPFFQLLQNPKKGTNQKQISINQTDMGCYNIS